MPEPIEIVPLLPARFEEASTLLARAFQDDPLHSRACPDPAARAAWLPHYFRSYLWRSHRFGLLLTTAGEITGIAAAIGPAGAPATPDSEGACYEAKGREALGEAWDRYIADFNAIFDPMEHAVMAANPGPQWYLDMLAVDPEAQGAGVGSALVRQLIAASDESGDPIVLLTLQPKNIPFYARHGFVCTQDEIEPGSGLRWWGYRRPAAGR